MKLMTGNEYVESLREYNPDIQVKGKKVTSVADEPLFKPGINAIAVTYELAHQKKHQDIMLATLADGTRVNRLNALDYSADDLLKKLEMTRLICKWTGCGQRYLMHDALSALAEITAMMDAEKKTDYHAVFNDYLTHVQRFDLTCGTAVTDAKGDRSKRPHEQADRDLYVRVTEKNEKGIIVSGAKANITGAPYVHEFIVLPTRAMKKEDVDYAVSFAVPVDAPGLKMIAKPAGRPGDSEAPFSSNFGQSTALVIFNNVFIPWDKVFLCGEWEYTGKLAEAFANHHRHSCIGARAGLGDMIIGASALMSEYNGLPPVEVPHIRRNMGELIRITEGFYATGVAASVYGRKTVAGNVVPDSVQSNIGKLMLAEQVYDIFRIAHEISGGIVVTAPTPEDISVEESGELIERYLVGKHGTTANERINMARLLEDLTASKEGGFYSVISLHGGGSPEAMRMSAVRNYDLESQKVHILEKLKCFAKVEGTCKDCVTCVNDEPCEETCD
ncbi:4-hydroxyphenylacetate 3-hydroxylase family protein [Halalkalibacter nanhaiisediminis]|uniref:4-hydroxybutyryl-CoA dehydratase/vinylacetyl-CoA-Delta-isomerase n=1 Tax=Halalkalibacter nanhaiisediminis TaxID=688079 RepID=A0A562QQC2_9BACI|nr:4-hydroxyphenylacetate 3-hydroxylase N-terminal domain-containing protein [Halalkalibacter nanhaiisediminis]TWI58961.1 4-hydroxybutyryl-CoA dehydratase/vinylacetyl-CoA-Delta-isomerase [Halalkalibacter nanhaiisediminis]